MSLLMTFVLSFSVGREAQGFESAEHESVSDDALQLAYVTTLRRTPPGQLCRVCPVLEQFFSVKPAPSQDRPRRISYGELVLLADFISDPLVALRGWDTVKSLPCEMKDVDVEALRDLKENRFALSSASHQNRAHFQQAAMKTQWWWHRSAASVAVVDENLFGALLLNAFADHFLEDFFAPGHIMTPREGLHDVAALGIHDNYNSIGIPFRTENWSDLEPLLRGLDDPRFQHLGTGRDMLSRAMRDADREIMLYGDNELRRYPMQRVFMVLVVARSIMDIVDSFETKRIVNHFDRFSWRTRTALSPDSVERLSEGHRPARAGLPVQPVARIRYGEYVTTTWSGSQYLALRENRYEVISRAPKASHNEKTPPDRNNDLITVFSPVLGLSVDSQTLMGRNFVDTRGVVTAEIMPIGVPPSGNYLRNEDGSVRFGVWQWGLGLGYSFVQGDGYVGHGPTIRTVFPLPDVDTQISLGTGARNYIGEGVDTWKPFVALTAEHGFGVFFLRLGLSWDSAIHRGRAESGVAVSGGLTVTLPWSRIIGGFPVTESSGK